MMPLQVVVEIKEKEVTERRDKTQREQEKRTDMKNDHP